jgi:hypothetical protein
MRYSRWWILLPGALTGACTAGGDTLGEAEKVALAQEVMETLGQVTQAMNAHEPERLFSYFRQDEEFLYLGCTDFLLGWGDFSSRVGPYYRANPDVTFEQEVVRVQVLSPTTAVAALRGGSSEMEDLFWTEVLVKEGGRWLIVHEHESWPGCSPPSGPHPFTSPEEMSEMGRGVGENG